MKTLILATSALFLLLSLSLLNGLKAQDLRLEALVTIHKDDITVEDLALEAHALTTSNGGVIKINELKNRWERNAGLILMNDSVELKSGQILSHDEIEFLILEKGPSRGQKLFAVPVLED